MLHVHATQESLVHADVTARNILIEDDHNIRLCDLGVAFENCASIKWVFPKASCPSTRREASYVAAANYFVGHVFCSAIQCPWHPR